MMIDELTKGDNMRQEELDRKWLERVLSGEGMNEEIEAIATWYDETPSTLNDETCEAWDHCIQEAREQAQRITALYGVEVIVVSGQPYNTPQEMFDDVETGRLQISGDNSEHPLLDLESNIDFRIWHDLTHYELHSNFEFTGEYQTYKRQVEHVREYSHRPLDILDHVLYCEVVAQAANGMLHKAFPVQKVFTQSQRKDN